MVARYDGRAVAENVGARSVAVQYAARGASVPTVFEISVGAIDRGASLSFLSQYPGEEEILLPPRSYLEVRSRRWHLVREK